MSEIKQPPSDHDLLIRIDERVTALKDGDSGDIPDIVKHLETINGRQADHEGRIGKLEGKVKIIVLALGGGIVGGGGIGLLIKLAVGN